MTAAADMRLLPVDYHKEVARELVDFFHTFYRFGAATTTFDLRDPPYLQFLHNLLLVSLAIGAVVFVVLCVVVVRRCILNIRSAYARRASVESNAAEITAVILLTFLAISALSGLLGEAQVDYSAGLVHDAMTNTSDFFSDARALTNESLRASERLRLTADQLVVSFPEADLPAQAFNLSVQSMRLLHSAKDLANQTNALLPANYAGMAREWELSYFVLKATTNGAILAVALASFLSISSIGWSMVAPLRLSVIVILSIVPVSHTLIGAYLAATMMTADFCAAPLNSTLTLLDATPVVEYYVVCPANVTDLPFADASTDFLSEHHVVSSLQQELERYAERHGDTGARMKRDYLDPIGAELKAMAAHAERFKAAQMCRDVSHTLARAAEKYCVYGMIGFFSMWGHQILLCAVLFVCVVASVLVYERVHIRELRLDVRYQLLSSYEEDDVEHVYLSAD